MLDDELWPSKPGITQTERLVGLLRELYYSNFCIETCSEAEAMIDRVHLYLDDERTEKEFPVSKWPERLQKYHAAWLRNHPR